MIFVNHGSVETCQVLILHPDLTGFTVTRLNRNPRADMRLGAQDFRGNLSGLFTKTPPPADSQTAPPCFDKLSTTPAAWTREAQTPRSAHARSPRAQRVGVTRCLDWARQPPAPPRPPTAYFAFFLFAAVFTGFIRSSKFNR